MTTITRAGSRAWLRATSRYAASRDIPALSARSFSSGRRSQLSAPPTNTTQGNTARPRTSFTKPTQRHAFTTSAPLRKTINLTEPRHDDEGKELNIEITPRAAKRLSEIMKVSDDPSFALRVQVQSGGCHGFQYITTNASIKSLSSLEEDESIFRFVEDDAPVPEGSPEELLSGPKVVLDEPSLIAVHGSKIDFTQALIGSKFEVVDNPYAENSCGCGSSFSLKL